MNSNEYFRDAVKQEKRDTRISYEYFRLKLGLSKSGIYHWLAGDFNLGQEKLEILQQLLGGKINE